MLKLETNIYKRANVLQEYHGEKGNSYAQKRTIRTVVGCDDYERPSGTSCIGIGE